MTATPEDLAYATYMLDWVDRLEWPQLAIADAALPQLRAFWTQSVDTDLDAISDQLWAWVDANGGPQPSTDRRMILVRMLICLAAVPNRELEQVGYFEDLLRSYGVANDEVSRARPRKVYEGAIGDRPVDRTEAAAAARPHPHSQRKAQVLWAFAVVSFVAGANPLVASSAEPPGLAQLAPVFAMVFLIYLWYRIDADERRYPRTPLLDVAIIMVAALAIPYYLVRSRGWQHGQIAILNAILVFLGSVVLSTLGAMLFGPVA